MLGKMLLLVDSSKAEQLTPEDCNIVLGVAEIVAATRGHPHKELPEDAAKWVARHANTPDPNLAKDAMAVVRSIKTKSETRALFEESGLLQEWVKELTALEKRLQLKPKKFHAP